MTKDEALKLALEALETNNKAWKHHADSGDAGWWEAEEQPFYEMSVKAITAIKEALAQPEQEPVQWGVDWGRAGETPCVSIIKRTPNGGIEVLAVEYGPQRKPLTDEEIRKANHHMVDGAYDYSFKQGVKWAEYKHGIKGEA
jgi:hypothetical protein